MFKIRILMYRLPNEIENKIYKIVNHANYHNNVLNKISYVTKELSDINYFLEKHIIQDIINLNKNTHLHYYIKNINKKLEGFIEDKGINLLLKINSSNFMLLSKFGESEAFVNIDKQIRQVGIYCILISNETLRFQIMYNFSLIKGI